MFLLGMDNCTDVPWGGVSSLLTWTISVECLLHCQALLPSLVLGPYRQIKSPAVVLVCVFSQGGDKQYSGETRDCAIYAHKNGKKSKRVTWRRFSIGKTSLER